MVKEILECKKIVQERAGAMYMGIFLLVLVLILIIGRWDNRYNVLFMGCSIICFCKGMYWDLKKLILYDSKKGIK